MPQQFSGPVTITGAGNQVVELSSTDPAASVTRLMAVTEVKELHRGTGNYEFDWEVKCVRKGHEDYRVTRPAKWPC
jgi:hypothetical protein